MDGERDPQLERLVTLTDGVFAIALTLLAIDLRLPAGAAHQARGALLRAIAGTWPALLAFGQSFAVLAIYWAVHHRLGRHLRRADGGLVWLTLAFLLSVAFLPFPAAVVGAHFADPAAGLLYFGALAASNAALWGLWRYAAAPARGLAPRLSPRLVRHYHRLIGLPAVLFALDALLAGWALASPSGRVPWLLGVGAAYLLAAGYLGLAWHGFREPA